MKNKKTYIKKIILLIVLLVFILYLVLQDQKAITKDFFINYVVKFKENFAFVAHYLKLRLSEFNWSRAFDNFCKKYRLNLNSHNIIFILFLLITLILKIIKIIKKIKLKKKDYVFFFFFILFFLLLFF